MVATYRKSGAQVKTPIWFASDPQDPRRLWMYTNGKSGKVKRIVEELKSFGKVRPAWVGINAMDLTAPVAQKLGWERSDGVVVESVDAGSPAAAAGVRQGDLVAELGGTPVRDTDETSVTGVAPGVIRAGQHLGAAAIAVDQA